MSVNTLIGEDVLMVMCVRSHGNVFFRPRVCMSSSFCLYVRVSECVCVCVCVCAHILACVRACLHVCCGENHGYFSALSISLSSWSTVPFIVYKLYTPVSMAVFSLFFL